MPSSYKDISSWNKYIAPLIAAAMISFTPPKITAPESIKPENIRSMQQEFTNTMTSYGYGKRNPYFTKDGVVERTSNNLYMTNYKDSIRNGRALGPDDYYHYGNWVKAATIYPPSEWNRIELPPRTSESGATESFGEQLLKLNVNDTQTPTYIHTFYIQGLRNNEAGKKLSEIENLKQRLTNHFGTKIAHALAEQAIKSGGSLESISYIGVGFAPNDVLYGVMRLRDGKILLIAGEDTFGELSRQARAWGIDTESYLETMLAEEQEHINRKSFDNYGDMIAEEMATKDSVFRKYLELAKGAEGGNPRNPKYERERRRRLIQAKIKEHDRDTTPDPERYGKYKSGSFHRKLYSESREDLEYILTEEAIEKGYRGRAAKEYVSKRLEEIGDEDTKESRMSRLEIAAKKGAEKADAKEADSKEAPEAPSE